MVHLKSNLSKHRLSYIHSWAWAVTGFVVFYLVIRQAFVPTLSEQFADDLTKIRPLVWGSCIAYFVVAWFMISERRLPYSNNVEVLLATSLIITSLLLAILAAMREFYSGTYLMVFLVFQVCWFGLEVYFRNRYVKYKFVVFPTDIKLEARNFPEQKTVFFFSPDAATPDGVDAVIVDFNKELDKKWLLRLAGYQNSGVPIFSLTAFLENTWGRIPVEMVKTAKVLEAPHFRPYLLLKPLLDRLAAACGIVFLFPVMLTLAVLVRISSPGPVLFRQMRTSIGGRPFLIYKFRTMHDGMEKLGTFATTDGDHRVTAIGRLLRKFHLDELPQLFNVVKGDMAIVGPRPDTVELTDLYGETIEYYSMRNIMKAGLTSWALIHQGNVSGTEAAKIKLSYDLYYFKHASFLLDFFIILKTLWVIFFGIERLDAPDDLRIFSDKPRGGE